jgi:hypothetical protein
VGGRLLQKSSECEAGTAIFDGHWEGMRPVAKSAYSEYRPPKIIKRRDPDYWLTIHIDRWEWEYALSLPAFEKPEVLDENTTLRLFGSTKFPDRPGIRQVEFRCFSKQQVTDPSKWSTPPDKVGELYRSRSSFEGPLLVGKEALPLIVTMLAAGHYREIKIAAVKVDSKTLLVRRYEFKQTQTSEASSQSSE